ncbi:hypothetical protein NUW58_g2150 [Xylaria curta]|uniref:Uncharacterized protein n=1 Tax=Xylaria curta TaxID=42375 RepID=A0ACC1PJJ9_9PEZI|nr:hypothetical protein NUW58_g2150 [Xylaria curta]
MSKEQLQCCPALDVSEYDMGMSPIVLVLAPVDKNAAGHLVRRDVDLHHIISARFSGKDDLTSSAKPTITLVSASANSIRKCEPCKTYFIEKFQMPKTWWSDYSRKSNGYFGCRATTHYIDTWIYFEIKHLEEKDVYSWYKLNIFVRWNKSTSQTIVLAFDTPQDVTTRIRGLFEPPYSENSNYAPFWFYTHLLSEVSRLQETAVWAIRDQVRHVEKDIHPKIQEDPDYRHLHDIARHAVHVSETLDVATQTIQRMLSRHEDVIQLLNYPDPSREIHSQLQFFESFLSSLKCRSVANEKRMSNEIQLAFNTVAQRDARTSVQIGRATQSDSVTMKSIAFVTLTFLPPTFVSAIFSMSFFNYSPESGWAVSDKFWVYWVVAVPITIATTLLWHCLRPYSASDSPKIGERRPTRFIV